MPYTNGTDKMTDEQKIYQEELRKIARRRAHGITTNTDNVLYFPNATDVRLCPKNGMTTLKTALISILAKRNPPDFDVLKIGTKRDRIEEIGKFGDRDMLPFRRGALRVCVVRDPVERFLSACEYIKSGNHAGEPEEKMSDVCELPDSLDDVIEGVWKGDIFNTHFLPQQVFLGNRGTYDRIFPMSKFSGVLSFLGDRMGVDLTNIRKNQTEPVHYGTKDALTPEQLEGIMRIYREDYNYGWTEED